MNNVFPNYYHKFKCIAEKCTHSCCIGWEIDIDEETFEIYKSLNTPLGEKIRANIKGEIPHFVLGRDGRCPFLLKNGLCEIISECGEDALCDICYLHPRFKNFYSSFTETGLGLCCEEACRIILNEKEKFLPSCPDGVKLTKKEKEFFQKREEIFIKLSDRSKSIYDRFCLLARDFGFEFDFSLNELIGVYLSLERLDEKWTKEINFIKNFDFDGKVFKEETFSLYFEALASYFVFRHLSSALEDGDYVRKIKFSLLSCYILGALFSYYNPLSKEKMIDIVRMYSLEIEYSEENTRLLMNL